MAFAIFYNMADLTEIATHVQALMAGNYNAFLTTQERNSINQTFQRFWTTGGSGWQTAPLAPVERRDDPDTRIIVITSAQINLQTLRGALLTLSQKVPAAAFMGAIYRDLGGVSGAVEPWP